MSNKQRGPELLRPLRADLGNNFEDIKCDFWMNGCGKNLPKKPVRKLA